jgi:hypothetical protein
MFRRTPWSGTSHRREVDVRREEEKEDQKQLEIIVAGKSCKRIPVPGALRPRYDASGELLPIQTRPRR